MDILTLRENVRKCEIGFFFLSGFQMKLEEKEPEHFRTFFHKGGGVAICKICGKAVTNMKSHYLTHQPEKHRCPICFSTTTRADNLKRHIRAKHPELITLPPYI
ncbi:hypothetical protein C0J52_25816 [Blattella germanica]|nr:hypothetical protein C0J52_25816 [Blattella germanica]